LWRAELQRRFEAREDAFQRYCERRGFSVSMNIAIGFILVLGILMQRVRMHFTVTAKEEVLA
jgi:hypothetical protein